MNRKIVLRIALVSCVIALVSCGNSSDTKEPTATLSDSQTVVTADQTTVPELGGSDSVTVAAAAKQYSSIVRKTNCALLDYLELEKKYSLGNGQVDLDSGLSDLTNAALKTATQRDIAVRALISKNWPEQVKSDLEALALFWASLQRAEITMSQSTDVGSWNSSVQMYISKATSSESGLSKIIRIKLDLPDFGSSEC